jgi:hypothetical protein
MVKPEPGETCRQNIEALIKSYKVIEEGNSRFKAIRGD